MRSVLHYVIFSCLYLKSIANVGVIAMFERSLLGCIKLIVFSGYYQVLGAVVSHPNFVPQELHTSRQDCDSKGASLFCRNSSLDIDIEVCHYCVNGSAVCSSIPDEGIICRYGHVYIRDCYCATYNNQTNTIDVGKCVYNCERKKVDTVDDGYSRLPQNISELNSVTCGDLHRDKTLCGRCEDTYYPMAFSYNMSCIKCEQTHWNWLKLVLFVFVPLTVFCFLIIIFNINITSTYLHGFIFFSQAVSVPAMSRVIILSFKGQSKYLTFIKILGSFFSIWNLDILRAFSPPMCLHINSLDILALDIVIGLYPLMLVVITHFMISLCDRRFKILRVTSKALLNVLPQLRIYFNKYSVIDSFATFFVLSNVKFMSVCFDMLDSIIIYKVPFSLDVYHKYGLYYDASSTIYSRAVRAVVTHLVLIVFTIFPILLLLLYPFKFFHRLLNMIPLRWHVLHTFVDVFQGGYKNRADGQTWDFRWFSSLFLILRLLVYVTYAITLSSVFFSYASMLTVVIVILLIILQPFKNQQDGCINSCFLLLLSLWYISVIGMNLAQSIDVALFFYGLCAVIAILPVIFLSVLSLIWFINQILNTGTKAH